MAISCKCGNETLCFFLMRGISLTLLTPNDPYSGRTAPLTSKRCILYIYSTNTGTEYFKHGIYSPFFFSLQNAVCFIILTYSFHVLFTFYIQSVLKFKKKNNNSGAKRLIAENLLASQEGLCSMELEWYMPVRNDSFLASIAVKQIRLKMCIRTRRRSRHEQ